MFLINCLLLSSLICFAFAQQSVPYSQYCQACTGGGASWCTSSNAACPRECALTCQAGQQRIAATAAQCSNDPNPTGQYSVDCIGGAPGPGTSAGQTIPGASSKEVEYAPAPETLSPDEQKENAVDFQNDTRIAAENDADFRAYGVPVLVLLCMCCFCGFALIGAKDFEGIGEKAPFVLLGVAVLQSFFAFLMVFGGPVPVVLISMHLLFFALPMLLTGLDPERRLMAKFNFVFCIINFLCLLGSFSILGYNSPSNGHGMWDFGVAFEANSVGGACFSYMDIDAREVVSEGQAYTRCVQWFNLIAIAIVIIALMQPIAAFASMLVFYQDDDGASRPTQPKNNNNNNVPMNNMNNQNQSQRESHYGPSPTTEFNSQHNAPNQQGWQ